jgi:hypothetical protein
MKIQIIFNDTCNIIISDGPNEALKGAMHNIQTYLTSEDLANEATVQGAKHICNIEKISRDNFDMIVAGIKEKNPDVAVEIVTQDDVKDKSPLTRTSSDSNSTDSSPIRKKAYEDYSDDEEENKPPSVNQISPSISPSRTPITKQNIVPPTSKRLKNDLTSDQLFQAVLNNDIEKVQAMISPAKNRRPFPRFSPKSKPNINCVDEQTGRTLLTQAILNENKEMVKLLLASGADPDLSQVHDFGSGNDINRISPLGVAATRKDPEFVTILMNNGAKALNTINFLSTPFDIAVASGNIETAKCLFDHGGVTASRVLDPLMSRTKPSNFEAQEAESILRFEAQGGHSPAIPGSLYYVGRGLEENRTDKDEFSANWSNQVPKSPVSSRITQVHIPELANQPLAVMDKIVTQINRAFEQAIKANDTYLLGPTLNGFPTIKDRATQLPLLTNEKGPSGDIKFNIADPAKNPGLVATLRDAMPTKSFQVISCGSGTMDSIDKLIAEFGGIQKLSFNLNDRLISENQNELSSKYPGIKFYTSDLSLKKGLRE